MKITSSGFSITLAALYGPVLAFSSQNARNSIFSTLPAQRIEARARNLFDKNKRPTSSSLLTGSNSQQETQNIAAKEKVLAEQESSSPSVASENEKEDQPFLKKIDGIVFISYLCNVMTLSLPVILLPLAAAEQVALAKNTASVAATVAQISSVASLGGAVGKFANGFICARLGSYTCSKWYLRGLALCSLGFSLSTTPSTMGMFFAGMEFFASIQWASLAVMLTNYYERSPPVALAAALTALGLSSTSGQILAKTFGVGLASAMHWRVVARFGTAIALFGSWSISWAPMHEHQEKELAAPKTEVPWYAAVDESLKALLTSKSFWMLALAHSMAFVCRGTDRVLGTFFHDIAHLPHSLCGGLTLSITLGLVYGLVTGSKTFSSLSHDTNLQKRFLAKRYRWSVAATLGLTAMAATGGGIFKGSKVATVAVVAMLSGIMAANVAFQYFQFPSMIAKEYGKHKAVCISFLDGFGFLLSVPIFAATAEMVPRLGWSSTWGMLAVLFAAASALMLHAIDPVLAAEKSSA